MLGLPAVSVPVGRDKCYLPIGLQLLGQAWHDGLVLRVAGVLESALMGTGALTPAGVPKLHINPLN